MVELVVAELKLALKVGRLEVRRPVDEESVEDEGLVLQVFVRGIGAMRHRVLISHEERRSPCGQALGWRVRAGRGPLFQ